MVVNVESKEIPVQNRKQSSETAGNGETEILFSPRFRSVAEMAGWDEEALLIASLVVEDTPDRQAKQKKRSDLHFKTPPTNSRRKRRAQRSPLSIPVAVLDLDVEDESSRQENEVQRKDEKITANVGKKLGNDESNALGSGVSCSTSAIPCMDRLREELSCAICLEICFEPSTTPCGHSFCKKCLRNAADKCGKRCPKCRQLISNGRSCTVNTVLWNTIQLLFPQEVESRKEAGAKNSRESQDQSVETGSRNRRRVQALNDLEGDELQSLERRRSNRHNLRSRSVRPSGISSRRVDGSGRRRREELPMQDEDAALALRLQREEFMEAFRGQEEQHHTSSSLMMARANLRAMASRAMNIRIRGRPT